MSSPPDPSPPPVRGHHRLVLVVIALAIAGLLTATVVDFLSKRMRRAASTGAPPPTAQPHLDPMLPIDVTRLAPLPTTEAVQAEAESSRRMVASRQSASLVAGFGSLALAWAEALVAADREHPPIPQSAGAHDLLLGGIRAGAAVVVSGRLDENVPAPGAEDRWRWATVAIDHGQQVLVLAPPDSVSLVLGSQVQISGRFLGVGEAPTATGMQRAAILVARALAAVVDDPERNQLAHGLANLREFHQGRLIMPDNLYSEIDEERPLLETRPYYYTLGQVKLDRSTPGIYDEAADGNALAGRIHQQPDAFRGKIFHLTGTVYDAWEDQQVAKDRPFEVVRVVRVLLSNEDYGLITENINGVDRTMKKWVLRLYELAVASDQPLPQKGEKLTATGRFLKLRAIPVAIDQQRDRANKVERQSDKVYTFLFVTPAFETLITPIEPTPWWHLVAVLAVGLLAVLAVIVVNRDRRAPAPHRVRAEALQYRQRMRAKPVGGTAAATGTPPPPADAGGGPTAG